MQNLEDVYKELQRLQGAIPPASAPVPAAVSVLWRDAADIEVYLVKRAPTMRFLPGFWTFPGGKADPGDVGAATTAARELQEETGVQVNPDELRAAGRWITPVVSPLRFDTEFFLAELPAEQEPDYLLSEGELVDGKWIGAAHALQQFEEGRLLLPAPALRVLEALAQGMAGAAERAHQASVAAKGAPPLWPVAGAIAISPLLTPTLPPATRTNCLVVGSGELVLVDPATPHPSEREGIARALDQRVAEGQKILEIWLTHHHGDHIGAAEFLSDRYQAPICAHAITAELLAGICRVDRVLADGETRVLAGPIQRELECIFTPGHAPGHLCFYEKHTRAMLVGDMLASVGTILIDPSEGNMGEYLDSLRRIRAKDASFLLPAHGFAISDPAAAIDHYLDHRMMRESRVVKALGSEPASLATLVKEVYDDTPLALHGLAQRSLWSHLLKLEHEGRAENVDSEWRIRS
jgi:glyoxylase-like metal-dependent hydrolase (beta-lactamase superfamily II)/8-oxo-dGTP pyrophosphatase MutT (NUDIX family)